MPSPEFGSVDKFRVQTSEVEGPAPMSSTFPMSGKAESDDPERTSDACAQAPDGDRFQLLRLHDRGGLGEVYVALDRELNREVALKRIKIEHADDEQGHADSSSKPRSPETWSIRAWYPSTRSATTIPDGRTTPCGSSEATTSSSRRTDSTRPTSSGRGPGERELELRRLLARFLDVCDAIDYAHSRGVLHRDIKPGNVMLGKFGETLVVDWGLAKSVGRADPGSVAANEEGTLAPGSGSGLQPTLAGSRMGTPAYMSPEQAAGRLDRLGPASDVYSLGATLYYVLVGRPPFEGPDLVETLRKVERGELARPR